MHRRTFLASCGCAACATTLVAAPGFTKAAVPEAALGGVPREVADIRVPDTKLATQATELVRQASPTPLFNHAFRSFVFGAALGAKLNRRFDPELVYLAAIMHDLGLVDPYIGTARFEIDGADATAAFLAKQSYPPAKADLVWEAIALHTSAEIPDRRAAEVALVHFGVFIDLGLMPGNMPAAFYDEVFEALPQMGNKQHFVELVAEVIRRKPRTAYLSFETDIGRRMVEGFNPPNYCDVVPKPPFDR